MKIYNKILLTYIITILFISIGLFIDNMIRYKQAESTIVELMTKMTEEPIDAIYITSLETEKKESFKLFYNDDSDGIFMILNFYPSSEKLSINKSELRIVSDDHFFIILPYPVSAFQNGTPYPVLRYQP